ncbi:DegT/DnrJ/EryC1/StrS family aminotransferase [Gemmatimonas sp.]|jgi:dTDP-4-amino-4,6-dideoxygalactose transaminase|uniref:DegT/DnrJ/EryC1/StrS family aminotransferase n=2 Tax=Gemmatimonas sp. TaxID=1962908 RepID=UPI0022BEB258|nr:DegT/DnrJ/EryC1/StrS family aminotransferase [Gemmatimonas sp.]MCA2984424.1 DegT/DnrJ/EryC1/StrS family aminotransferase [Gemmatimonas sp.]MCA2988888.1 DegT/DnrJ/EryC1/StrS family aminotransferase [Gemmatimonas sp.]MCA2991836.1 DegT/DnrJ/EryC1/StrS family aminotransferase [Gemmatimonas sp.]MCE2954044.1 DegT/DnrJ/EryC1/StrS family aminotransferase [Gemmatimonas sp.]MCZ8013417.1 DegT/DnrJ/EryC1/StrS family aminotransferase [Gemmatimonas sp.]
MAVPLLDLKAQHATIRDEVVAALMEVVDQQAFILGDPVAQLECSVAGLSQVKYAVGCANGTDAILLALRALGVGHGDEVVTTPFTFFATGGAIHNVGARPVFVDIDPRSFNIAPDAITPAITPRTRAVIAVDLFGQMAPIEQVSEAAQGRPVIEDAAQSIGASRRIGGRTVMAGEAAAIGTYSFFPSKNLGGYGDGGMMVTQDEALFEALMKLRTHGSRRTYYHEIVGYNSRLDALQAAVLRAKLPHLGAWSEARRRNAAYYDAAFADVPELVTPWIDPANTSIYNQYTVRVPRREAVQAHLKERGIGSNVYYPLPLHLQPCFAYLGYREGQCPEAEKASREVLSLPVYPELTTTQLDEVIAAVRAYFGR